MSEGPYRTAGVIVPIDPRSAWQDIFKHNDKYQCPACHSHNRYYKGGEVTQFFKGCIGKKDISNNLECPNLPHLHVTCWCCKLQFLMWST